MAEALAGCETRTQCQWAKSAEPQPQQMVKRSSIARDVTGGLNRGRKNGPNSEYPEPNVSITRRVEAMDGRARR